MMDTVDKSQITQRKKISGLRPGEEASRPLPSWRKGNWKFNWVSTSIIVVPLLLSLGAVVAGVPLHLYTFIAAVIGWCWNGMGITLGYHRFFAHRAFNASKPLRAVIGFAGAGAFEGSIKWWARNHRIHHRYVDTDKDPYNANRGFIYSHCGWMIMKQDYELLGHVDVADLNADPVVRFNHKHYLPLAILSGVVLPVLVCGLGWGDWMGGLFYAGFAKIVFVHHCTFFINSLAHTGFAGALQGFSMEHTSHDSWLCALLTFGEGYHNFHHEFAQDYRNGIMWYHWDPTKWMIRLLEMTGHAKHLVRIPNSVIESNKDQVRMQKIEQERKELEKRLRRKASFAAERPEVWSWETIAQKVEQGQKLTVIGGYVLDLEKTIPTGAGYTHSTKDVNWYNAHPGGRKMLDMYIGKDATSAVTGGVYRHSRGAFNLIQQLYVASVEKERFPSNMRSAASAADLINPKFSPYATPQGSMQDIRD